MLLSRDLSLDVVDGELCPQIAADLRLRRLVRLKRIAELLGGRQLVPPSAVERHDGLGRGGLDARVRRARSRGWCVCAGRVPSGQEVRVAARRPAPPGRPSQRTKRDNCWRN
jgi:hypothetical protein